MSPVEVEMIQRKLGVIVENLKALGPIKEMTREAYAADLYKRKATERLLQELIEAAIDINTHIIVQAGYGAPDDFYNSFIKAGKLKIISEKLARELAPSAGLRNRLVHEYDVLEHWIVLDAVKEDEEKYSRYIKEINDYISKIAAK